MKSNKKRVFQYYLWENFYYNIFTYNTDLYIN